MNSSNNSCCLKYSQKYSKCCYSPNINIYTKWQTVPYAGESTLPVATPPSIGCDPLVFLKRNCKNQFVTPSRQLVNTKIENPYKYFDLKSEFEFLSYVQCNLTCEQIRSAFFWQYSIDQFYNIANTLISAYNVPINYAARIINIFSGALNDILVITDSAKFCFNMIRPNQYNRCFKTVLCTPKDPAYPSGHSTIAACLTTILSYFFPCESKKLCKIALDCSNSRYYSGVHFKGDCTQGLILGRNVAKAILCYLNEESIACYGEPYYQYKEYKNANIMPNYSTFPIPKEIDCTSLLLNIKCN